MLLTEVTQQEYNLEKIKKIEGTPISDINGKGNEVFDGSFNTVYVSEAE